MAFRLKDTNKGYRELVRRVFGFKRPVITVGIHAEDGADPHGDDGVAVIDVAIWNEFGTNRIPERSFIRAGVDEAGPEAEKRAARLFAMVLTGKLSKAQALEQLGAWLVGAIQKRIAKGIPPQLAPSTIQKKTVNGRKGNVPLIDTGQLRSSITYKVKEG